MHRNTDWNGEGSKRLVKNVAPALLMVLTLCSWVRAEEPMANGYR